MRITDILESATPVAAEQAKMDDVKVEPQQNGWVKVSVEPTSGHLIALMRSIGYDLVSKPKSFQVKTKSGGKFNLFNFKSNGLFVQTNDQAKLMDQIAKTLRRHNKTQVSQAKWKASAPKRKKESQKYYSKVAKANKEKKAQDYGAGTANRVKIRQIGGDDGYQWNVIVDGHSVMNGLTKREAEYYQKKEMDRLAKEASIGKYAPKATTQTDVSPQ